MPHLSHDLLAAIHVLPGLFSVAVQGRSCCVISGDTLRRIALLAVAPLLLNPICRDSTGFLCCFYAQD